MMGERLFGRLVAPYAKAWVGFLGFVGTTTATVWEGCPEWVAIGSSVLTAVGVYLTPNAEADE